MKTLNNLYSNYKNGKITLEKLKNKILEIIFKERHYFNLHIYDEDYFSEILLQVNKYLNQIILNYDEAKGSFPTYLKYSLETMKKSIFYFDIRTKSKENAILDYIIEDTSQNIQEEEPIYEFSDSKPLQIDFRKMISVTNQKTLSNKKRIKIIILKACNYLTDEHIFNICKDFEIDYEKMHTLVQHAKKTLTKKKQKSNRRNNNLIRVYVQKHRYEKEIGRYNKDTVLYAKAQKALDYNSALWKKYLELDSLKPVTPSNQTISDLLNIPYYCVNTLLSDISKNYRKNSEKKLS